MSAATILRTRRLARRATLCHGVRKDALDGVAGPKTAICLHERAVERWNARDRSCGRLRDLSTTAGAAPPPYFFASAVSP